ncbi:hypothetical protein [Gordonia soli]|uniref:PspA domain-containing protein n=1 Tax=Gordonia soli NBRC 108243 TaxID=1223545 RepID=M0QRM1_9ACTN|nr:hypothetical protein [Gordonia soli]GAC71006.1 hypothetical protein GS4_46_00200 [Gordonia soli NBRC 108243]
MSTPGSSSPDASTPDQPTDTPTGQSSDPSAAATSRDDEIFDAEIVSPGTPIPPTPGDPHLPGAQYTDAGVPTFDFVRDKIENRIATAIGSEELAHESAEGRQVDEMIRKRDEAAKKKLDEIRKSMGQG